MKDTKVKAIIFDMYGVIMQQTGDDFVPYVQKTFPNLEPQAIYEIWFRADIGEISSLDVWKKLGFRGDIEKIEKEYLDTIKITDGFLDFIYHTRMKHKLAIISNDSSRWSYYLRKKFDLNQYFDVISISGDLKIQKPDERIFQYTVEQLGCKSDECLYIDDREKNVEIAAKIGMQTVLFNSRNVRYFGESVKDFEELSSRILIE